MGLGKDLFNAINGKFSDGTKYSASTPIDINAEIAKVITKKIKETKIAGAYAGTTTTVPPAPYAASGNFKVTGSLASIPPASGEFPSSFSSWVSGIEAGIKAGFSTEPSDENGLITIVPVPAFATNPMPLATFLNPGTVKDKTDAEDTWDAIGSAIIDWVNAATIPAPTAGTTASPPSAGSVTFAKFTLND